MTFQQWFDRTCGTWTSERRYLFAPKFKPVNLTTNFTIDPGERGNQYVVNWQGQTSGTMELTLDGDMLHRSRDYFGDGANSSKLELVGSDTIILRTEYDGTRFREEITLIEGDCYRLRQTVGFCLETGKMKLSGQYLETRIQS